MPAKLSSFYSWNVNGLRACIGKGFFDFLEEADPSLICLQEVKALPEDVDLSPARELGYHAYWNSADKKGYSGTLMLSKNEPLSVKNGIGITEHDTEGRVITLEFESYFVVGVYTPNAQGGLKRLPYRQSWDKAFLGYCQELEKTKPVLICGDLNVSHQETDLANPDSNRKSPGFSDEERSGMDDILEAGWLDSLRVFHKGPGFYTWWTYRVKTARERNIGWRLDYWLVSKKLRRRLKSAEIHPQVFGSDHCPVSIQISG